MGSDPQLVVTAGGLAVAVIVWLVRLEGRVNTTESVTKSLRDDVTYIRNRIDQALNGHLPD
jgi:hypothetical protein